MFRVKHSGRGILMEVYLLESLYDDFYYMEFLVHIPNTDYWFGICEYEDYDTLSDMRYTDVFWKSVEEQQKDFLTYLGEL